MLAMFTDKPNHVNIRLHGWPLCSTKAQLKKTNQNNHHHQNKWEPRIMLKHYILGLNLTESDFSVNILGKASTSSSTTSAPERWAGVRPPPTPEPPTSWSECDADEFVSAVFVETCSLFWGHWASRSYLLLKQSVSWCSSKKPGSSSTLRLSGPLENVLLVHQPWKACYVLSGHRTACLSLTLCVCVKTLEILCLWSKTTTSSHQ